MSWVYKAWDTELHRWVALKLLKDESPAELDRLMQEARTSAKLTHPNIAAVHEANGRYIAMQWLEGQTLAQFPNRDLRTVVDIVMQVAYAVHFAHQHAVIHRDLKPQNIMIDPGGWVYVMDFGLAQCTPVGPPTEAKEYVLGTPSYMSPEQVKGVTPLDLRTDVYSLGATLYELATGYPPFRADTVEEVLAQIVSRSPKAPGQIAPQCDKELESIILRCLEKDPGKRYSEALALADDLGRWLEGFSVTRKTKRVPKKIVTSILRRKAIVIGCSALMGLLLSVALYFWKTSHDEALTRRRVEELLACGERARAEGKYADALVAFAQAAEIDPTNHAAAAGRLETEKKILASTALRQPGPATTQASPSRASSPLDRAREFARANPKDFSGQIRMWKEARTAVQGTPDAAEVRRELDAVQSRRDQAVAAEFEDIDRAIDALRDAESFGAARDILKQAAKRHEESDWQDAVAHRTASLQSAVTSIFSAVKTKATEARRRDDSRAVEEARARVARWKRPELSADLEEALARIVPAPAPSPSPPPPADTQVLQGLPELPSLLGHRNGITSAAFSPDGAFLVTASFDNTTKLWSVSSHSEKASLLQGSWVRAVAFSPDGKWVAAGLSDGPIRLWDTATLKVRNLPGHLVQVTGVAFSPDSRLLASSSVDGSVRLWDCASGSQKQQLDGHAKGAMTLCWSPDGRLLGVATANQEIKIWEMPAGRERPSLKDGIRGVTSSIAFSADGRSLASAGEDTSISIWTLETGQRRELAGHTKEVRCIAWSTDGLWIASASVDGTLRIWEAASGQLRCRFLDQAAFFATCFSRKGDMVAGCSGEGSVRLWDLSGLRPAKPSKD